MTQNVANPDIIMTDEGILGRTETGRISGPSAAFSRFTGLVRVMSLPSSSIGFCIRSGMKLDAAVPISGKNSRARQEQEAEKAAGGIIEYNNLRGVR